MDSKVLFITNWEYITFKNDYQINYLSKKFDKIIIFTPDKKKHSKKICENYNNIKLINHNSSVIRFLFFFIYIIKYRKINLISLISPYGHSSFFYFVTLKIFNSINVSLEWGPIDLFNKKKFIERFFSSFILKKSNFVWYKEHYMKKKLISLNKNLFFIPNVTNAKFPDVKYKQREIDFLWFNNFENRLPKLLIDALKVANFKNKINCVMIGDNKGKFKKYETNNNLYSLQILNFSDDRSYIYNSKYFIIFANRIFGNNSLLESMSVGTVPIISKVSDTGDIIHENLNGFIVENNILKISSLLEKINLKDDYFWHKLSNECKNKIKREYNVDKWVTYADKLFNKCLEI